MPHGNRGENPDSYREDWNRAINGSRGGQAANVGSGYADAHRHHVDGRPQAGSAFGGRQPAPAADQAHAEPLPDPDSEVRAKRGPQGCYVVLSWAALFAWAAFIFYMSAHTSSDLSGGIFARVKEYIEYLVWTYYGYVEDPVSPIGHFCEYFILGALLGNALHCHMPLVPATVIAVLVASGYGVTDEIHQIYVDGRYPDIEDWKVDTMAAGLGSIAASFLFYFFPARK